MSPRSVSRLSFVFFILCLTAKSTFGQTYRTFNTELNNINTTARWIIGPFRLSPTFQLGNVGFDSNVFYRRTSPLSDYTATISLRAEAHFVFRNWLILSFTENPAYVYFVEQENQRYLNNAYILNLRVLVFSRIAISGSTDFTKEKSRWTGETDANIIHEVRRAYARISYETARNTSLGFVGSIRKTRYEDFDYPEGIGPISTSLNREEKSAAGEFYYRVFSDSTYFATLGYSESQFEYPQASFRDSYSYEFMTGLQFPLLGRARGLISLGYRTVTPRRREHKSFGGLVGDSSLSLKLGRFSYRLDYARDASFSTRGDNVYYVSDRYGAGVSFYLNRFIRLDYDYSRRENNYPNPTQVILPDGSVSEIKRRDKIDIHSGAVVFRVIKSTGIGLRLDYWGRYTNLYRDAFKRTFIGGYLTYEF
jgi:hypothetical protein